LKGVKDERHQAKDVEMHSASRVPTPGKNKEADEKVQYPNNAQIIFNRGGPLSGLNNELNFKLLAAPLDLVVGNGPQPDSPQTLRDIDRAMDRQVIDCKDPVVRTQTSVRGWRFWRDMPGNNFGLSLDPRHSVIGRREHGPLLEIDSAKDDGRKSRQCKNSRAQPNPKIVVDWSVHQLSLQSHDKEAFVQLCFQII
jgi:hypothetical protein